MISLNPLSTIPLTDALLSRDEVRRQAESNLEKIKAKQDFELHATSFIIEARADLPARAKMNRMKKAAQALSEVVTPLSACKAGCSHCCNISAVITDVEAEAMAKASGRKTRRPKDGISADVLGKWFRAPCPFLIKGRCSVYEDRPLVCRLQFNISDTSQQCDTSIPPTESYVTMLNLSQLQNAYVEAFHDHQWGDIRDFFR